MHFAGAVPAENVMMERSALAQRHTREIALGGIGCLADRFRHFARLAMAKADPALLVADDDKRGEAEAPAALHYLGDAIDMHELVDKLAVALFAVAPVFTCHIGLPSGARPVLFVPLKAKPAFTRGIGQRLDAAVIEIAPAVKHHLLTPLQRALREDSCRSLRRVAFRRLAAFAHDFQSTKAAATSRPSYRDTAHKLLHIGARQTHPRRLISRRAHARVRPLSPVLNCHLRPYFFLPPCEDVFPIVSHALALKLLPWPVFANFRPPADSLRSDRNQIS